VALALYHPKVRFTCSRCGKRYASTDEPVRGRIYAIGCRCGHTIVVKGPDVSGGVRNGATAPARDDPFADFHGKYQLPAREPPARSRSATPGMRASGAEPARQSPSPSPWHALPPPPPMRPSASEPPAPRQAFDPDAAGQGLLLDVDQARPLSSGSIETESLSLPPALDDEVSITFSERLALPDGERRRRWLVVAAAALGCLVVVGGLVAVLSGGPATPTPVESEPRPAEPPEQAPAAAPAVPSVPALPAAPPQPAPRALAAPRPFPAPPARPPAVAKAAPVPDGSARPALRATRPGKKAAPLPAVTEEPAPANSSPGDGSTSPALLDLLSRKADAPAAVPPRPERDARGSTPGVPEVQAVLERNRSAFESCVEEAGPDAHLSGRHVFLAVTVNPSGIVTSPRLDDAALDGSPTGTCLKAAARKLVLAPFAGEPVRVRVPMTLAP